MRHFGQSITGMGHVIDTDPGNYAFKIRVRSGDTFQCFVNEETQFSVLRNLDGQNPDRFTAPRNSKHRPDSPPYQIEKYLRKGMTISVDGIYQEDGEVRRFDARAVHLLARDTQTERYLFEETHWWLSQIDRLSNQWLENLFGQKRSFIEDDFASLYQTNLNILGLPSDDNVQEMATLSRSDLWAVIGLPPDRRRAVPDRRAGRGGVPARDVPLPEPRRPLLLLGLRAAKGAARHAAGHDVGEPRRHGHHPPIRADLRPRRAGPVLPDHR